MKEKKDVSTPASEPSTSRERRLLPAGAERQRSALQRPIIYLHFLCPPGLTSSSAFPYPRPPKTQDLLGGPFSGRSDADTITA